jgi:argininosuccinate lyase
MEVYMKLWSGRFLKEPEKLTDDFNSSIHVDSRLYRQDIKGSIAHVKMLSKCGIINEKEAELICNGLNDILADIENGRIMFETEAEDIHMNIEKLLIERLGDVGKKLHTARSRNDQIALDTRMYVKTKIKSITNMLINLEEVLLSIADRNTDTILPGYTHLQRAQPVTFAHHIMAYFEMFKRDIDRLLDCYKRTDTMPLGSGALAGTTYPIDRQMVAKELGFSSITANSIDAVSDRDFVLELCFILSVVMMHLSRFCEELVIWSSFEFKFIEMDDAFSTGSSIMPQKKNSDVAELVRGKTGRVYGNLMALLTIMKSLPLAYNKDMQEDKEALFDSIDTLNACLPVFTEMISTIKINKTEMYEAAKEGFTNATDLADYLVKKGVPFRSAHEITGKIVLYCIDNSKSLNELKIDEYKTFSGLIENDIYDKITVENCVLNRKLPGGPSKSTVLGAIKEGRKFLSKLNTFILQD